MRKSFSAVLTLSALTVLAAFAQPAAARPGSPDPTFGGTGAVTKVIDNANTYGRTVAPAPGGKSYVSATSSSSPQLLDVLRYNADGSLDTSFGGDGIAQIGNSGQYINGGYLVVQPDGKPVVAGVGDFAGNQRFIAARLNTDGTPDGSFGLGGFTSVAIATDDYGFAVALQADGKVVIAGRSGNPEKASLARLTTGGVLDSTFGPGTGKVTVSIPSVATRARAVTVAPNGSIYIAGLAEVAAENRTFVAKLTAGGVLDTSFNGTGYSIGTSNSGSTGFMSVAVQTDGKILASGATLGTTYKVGAIVRYLPSGTLDPTFAAGGFFQATPSTANTAECNGLALLPYGRINYVCSQYDGTSKYAVFVGRLLPNGSPDPTFGVGGVSAPLGSSSTFAESVSATLDGKLLITGLIDGPTTALFAARFDNGIYAPTAAIASPSKSKLSAKKLTKFSGKAAPEAPAAFVTKVEIAVRKLDAKALKKKKQCIWLSSSKAKFSKIKDKTKQCAAPKWLAPVGTAAWSYKLKSKRYLPVGKYRLLVRVTLIDGSVNTTFDKGSGTLKSFTLTKSKAKKKKKKK
jgi:uncharacterized delta-60 repeat protein